ncbi:MAG TPA: ATP synthase F1 subunit gamma [Methylomirabilota bacterium]|nr:ATP synthase F1 subunit gamma [Methylomirabilota bacterium]
MATLRDIRRRIRSVKSTAQITKTMEMVSAAKLRRAQAVVESARPYATDLAAVLANLASEASGDLSHPAFQGREVRRRAIILVTSDRGLSGAFNANLIRAAEQRVRQKPLPTQLVLLGKKGFDYFRRRGVAALLSRTDLGGVADWKFAEETSRSIIARFEAGELDEVDLIYTKFQSALTRYVVVDPYLPLGKEAIAGATGPRAGTGARRDYIYEPDPGTILARIVPYFLAMRLYMALAESAAAEHGARMIAMGSATKNANEMIQTLTLHMNRTRQATITRELVEIVGGAEALK